jgi:hypothetical protein
MNARRTTYQLDWPRTSDEKSLTAFFRSLAGHSTGPITLEALSTGGEIVHRLELPTSHAAVVLRRLALAVPGVRASLCQPDFPTYQKALQLKLSSRQRPLRADLASDTSLALLSALAGSHRGEHLLLQWTLGPRLRAVAIPNQFIGFRRESWLGSALTAPVSPPRPVDPELRSAIRGKQSLAGWRMVGRIAVGAASESRGRQLLHELLSALRVAESPGLRLEARPAKVRRITERSIPWRWPSVINEAEIVGLSAWPIGDGNLPGVSRSTFTLTPTAKQIPRRGRVVGDSTYPGNERPLAISGKDALRHTYLLGPTGVGKSTLIAHLALADARDGRGVIVVDPKGDLVDEIAARLPAERLDDVVVFDPSDADRPIGLNPLRGPRSQAPVLADRIVSVFRALYGDNLGPRSEDILHSGLLTLAYAGNQTLTALPLLLTNPGFRQRLTAHLGDPLGLGSFWQWYEGISEAERRQAIAPISNKLRAFLVRPTMRRMLGQVEPRFQLHQVFTERKILLVSLASGTLGPETAQLFGALLLADVWQQALSRSHIAPGKRHPVMLYVDEFQHYLRLPTPLADVLAMARGLGVGLTIANQHLAQLTPDVRSAVLGNAGSRIVFRLNEDDAGQLARDSRVLAADDFRGLGAFEAYASLLAAGDRTPYASIRTRPAEPALRSARTVRAASAEQWGRPAVEVDAALQRLISAPSAPDAPIGRRARPGAAHD